MHLTPFNAEIKAAGARLVEYAGWEMAVTFSGLMQEHHAVRTCAAVFDVSHMGRLDITGSDALAFLNKVTTRQLAGMDNGRIRYGILCKPDGGAIDDILAARVEADQFQLVVNGANRETVLAWFEEQKNGMDVTVTDQTFETAMLALQGPEAVDIMDDLGAASAMDLKYYAFAAMDVAGIPASVSRTGYTGEDGFEIVVAADDAVKLWQAIFSLDHEGLIPAGLGARDTLRLEAGMPLYGHELTAEISPVDAGLNFGISLDKDAFIGREALLAKKESGTAMKRIGFKVHGRGIAREEFELFRDGEPCGFVTSGTFSPTLEAAIGMGYIKDGNVEGDFMVQIRKKQIPIDICSLPFYKRQ